MSALKYQRDFLRYNKLTQDQFERIYIAFMKTNPDEQAYRKFAAKHSIQIIEDAAIPVDMQVVLSVNISVMKVLAKTEAQAIGAINDIVNNVGKPPKD
jgi:hypothetical protein